MKNGNNIILQMIMFSCKGGAEIRSNVKVYAHYGHGVMRPIYKVKK